MFLKRFHIDLLLVESTGLRQKPTPPDCFIFL